MTNYQMNSLAITAPLTSSTLVMGTGTRRQTTHAFAITALLTTVTLVVVRTGTRTHTTDAFAILQHCSLVSHWWSKKQK